LPGKMAVVAVSAGGAETARRVKQVYPAAQLILPEGIKEELSSGASEAGFPGKNCRYFKGGLKAAAGAIVHNYRSVVMVMAVGIAVRVLAPYLNDKIKDPAVVILDDRGDFAVSLLSGHLGGANDLAEELARHLGAVPVVTTATDRREITAVDLVASRLGWEVEDMRQVKVLSARQLKGNPALLYMPDHIDLVKPVKGYVTVESLEELSGKLGLAEGSAEGNAVAGNSGRGASKHEYAGVVLVSNSWQLPRIPGGLPRVVLRPRDIVAGVGSRRGASSHAIVDAIKKVFYRNKKDIRCLSTLATVKEKAVEPGFKEAAGHLGVPLKVIDKNEIALVEHLFYSSPLVKDRLGIGAVAEPCAYLGSSRGRVISSKTAFDGITVALGEAPISCDFGG